MNSAIIVAIITVVGGGLFALLQRVVDKRYSKAKEVFEKNSATIVDMVNVVEGLKVLNEEYRIKIAQQEAENKKQGDEIKTLKTELRKSKGGSR